MSQQTSTPVSSCQICGSTKLESIIFVGYIPPVNSMWPLGAPLEEQPAYPLEWLRCGDCGLVQIGLEIEQNILFPYSYPYLSGTTRVLRDNFADLAREASSLLGLSAESLVVDIGSNDGSLLAPFQFAGTRVLGVEPSQASVVARDRGIPTITGYFNATSAKKVVQEHGPANLITAANVFAHIGNIHDVLDALIGMLAPQGVFVSESHYLVDLVDTLQYDTIYHEHLRYYSLSVLSELLRQHGLEVFRTKRIPTHGGSIRVYAARRGERPIDTSVEERLVDERSRGFVDGQAYRTFRIRTLQSKLDLMKLIAPIKQSGARIYGIGAPSRGSTLVNYTGLDDGILDCILEVSDSHKLNHFMPGTRIPVLDERKLFEDQPEFALFLSWHIADELMTILKRKGFKGQFIVPLPEPRIVSI